MRLARSGPPASLLALLCILPGLTGSALSQPSDSALLKDCEQNPACRSHLTRANRLYEQGIFSGALEEYQAAYVLQPYPLILYNIARIHHRQGHLAEAMTYYRRYLETGHAERQERTRQLLAEAEQELGAQTRPQPPPPAVAPAPPAIAVAPPLSLQGAQAPAAVPTRETPLYKRWWLWTVIGVTAAGAATALGIGLYARGPDVSGLPSQTASFRP